MLLLSKDVDAERASSDRSRVSVFTTKLEWLDAQRQSQHGLLEGMW